MSRLKLTCRVAAVPAQPGAAIASEIAKAEKANKLRNGGVGMIARLQFRMEFTASSRSDGRPQRGDSIDALGARLPIFIRPPPATFVQCEATSTVPNGVTSDSLWRRRPCTNGRVQRPPADPRLNNHLSRYDRQAALRKPATLDFAHRSFLTDLVYRVDPLEALRFCNMRGDLRRRLGSGRPLARRLAFWGWYSMVAVVDPAVAPKNSPSAICGLALEPVHQGGESKPCGSARAGT